MIWIFLNHVQNPCKITKHSTNCNKINQKCGRRNHKVHLFIMTLLKAFAKFTILNTKVCIT